MPSHADLAAAGPRLGSASAYAVAHAVLHLREEGTPATVERVMALTGYGRSAVYDARARLREVWPEEFGPEAADVEEREYVLTWIAETKSAAGCADCGWNEHPGALHFHHRDPTTKRFSIARSAHKRRPEIEEEMAKCDVLCARCHAIRHLPPIPTSRIAVSGMPDERPPSRTPVLAGRLSLGPNGRTPATTNGSEARPAWRVALESVAADLPGRRSWDLYDAYSAAWDHVLALVPEARDPFPDLIALAVHMLETVLADDVDRAQVAKLVRLYGKAALFGLHKALGVTETDSTRDLYRYGRAVAQNVVAEMKGAPA